MGGKGQENSSPLVRERFEDLEFGDALLDQASPSESAFRSCENKNVLLIKAEISDAGVAPTFRVVYKDKDGKRWYSTLKTLTNTGVVTGATETGYRHAVGIEMPTKGALSYAILLVAVSAGDASFWTVGG